MRQYCKKSCRVCVPVSSWGAWSRWSRCTKTCGGGSRYRTRTCYGRSPCYGLNYQSVTCNTQQCPVSSPWCFDKNLMCASWAKNGECQKNPRYMVPNCKKSCKKCVVNGNWEAWGGWTTCSKTCGAGIKSRSRTCSNPAPQNGGLPCAGLSAESTYCNPSPCKVPVHGNWGAWGGWSACSKTCGGGTMFKSRTCSNPAPQNGGRTCAGLSTQSQSCNSSPCKVNGNWAAWGEWGICSKTCGGGYRRRDRTCTNPAPHNGGLACQGSSVQLANCNTQLCPVVDGQWGLWSQWTPCSKTCGIGVTIRIRYCDNPAPENGGKPCVGNNQETLSCSLKDQCPAEICGRPKPSVSRIVGGEVASNRDWPWQIGLQKQDDDFIFCGGSLINQEWVLTAAHCITRHSPSKNGCVAPNPGLRIILGEFDKDNIDGHEVQKTVSEICMHPEYDHSIFNNDIALLRMASPLPGYNDTMIPICLPTASSHFPAGTNCSVTGWGRTQQSGWSARKLRVARVPIIDHANCKKQYLESDGEIVTDKMFCAGYQEGKVDSCKGDSGGPFVCKEGGKYVLAGATSWGVGCAQAGRPGVYTDIKKFLNWIEGHISTAEPDP